MVKAAPVATAAGGKVLLMGNEAIARGAVEGGVQVVAAYPGTPSSEVVETLARQAERSYYVEWSTNEKVAFDLAMGAASVGARTLVVMKNAGLNVAMDSFMTVVYTGVRGGLVVVVADDPGAHYSSNEQDTRVAAVAAAIPCLEPSCQQEAKDMTREAFELSERLELPVFVRSVCRISHASGDVVLHDSRTSPQAIGFNKHFKLTYRWNVYGPPGPVAKHRWLLEHAPEMKRLSEDSPFNCLRLESGARLGVIAVGIGAAYAAEAMEKLGLGLNFLKLGFVNPIPEAKVLDLLRRCHRVLVIEEGDPVVETAVRVLAQAGEVAAAVSGKLRDEALPPYGELTPDLVEATLRRFAGLPAAGDAHRAELKAGLAGLVAPRSSTLCAGCPHLGTYWAIRQVTRGKNVPIVNGDIGCYEQGGYGIFAHGLEAGDAASQRYRAETPYEVLDTLYVMGSGIGMAQGQAHAGYRDGPILAVAGDSTFFHAALPALANAVYNQAKVVFVVLDNRWTAMTGHQPNPVTGQTATGAEAPILDIEAICRAMGVGYVKAVDAFDLEALKAALGEALRQPSVAVVIPRGECRLQFVRRTRPGPGKTRVEAAKCNGCKTCLRVGCPAIGFSAAEKKASIEASDCNDCGLCAKVCPTKAIGLGGEAR